MSGPKINSTNQPQNILRDTAAAYGLWLSTELGSAFARRGPQSGKELLLLASTLPPWTFGGVYRPLSWLRLSSSFGWKACAITMPHNRPISEAGRYLQELIPPESPIIAEDDIQLRPSWRFFPRIDGGLLRAFGIYRAGVRHYRGHAPSIVVATGPDFAVFVAGLFLSRHFGVKLVLDYRDEWSESPFPFVRKGNSDRIWERRCLKAADRVMFTTQSQLIHQTKVFRSGLHQKGIVLPNGWADSNAAPKHSSSAGSSDTNRLVLTFAGNLGDHTPPGPFLKDCRSAVEQDAYLREQLLIRFIGLRSASADEAVSSFSASLNFDLCGLKPKPEAERMVRESNALLVMAVPDLARYMPGKMFDYIASGRPILVHGHQGEVSDLVTKLDAGVFVQEGDAAGLARALHAFKAEPQGRWDNDRRRTWAKQHTREVLAERFFRLLEEVIAEERR